MGYYRPIYKITKSRPTMEGAGVRLNRVFGEDNSKLDPFLLLDDFHSDNPDDYIAGFPWHPHRGIETITYMLHGLVQHEDSLGNAGTIESGDVQWMTAGSGIIHQEMPAKSEGLMGGFQLWSNLPSSHKMMDPRYQGVNKSQIPEVSPTEGVNVKIICGEVNGIKGPVQDIVTDPEYIDVQIESKTEFKHRIKKEHNVFAYVIDGEGYFDESKEFLVSMGNLVIFDDGAEVFISTGESKVRFLLISGNPIREPVVWHGPIVMNTKEEIRIAFEEYRNDTFIKKGK